MGDSPTSRPKADKFKSLYKTIIRNPPTVVQQLSSRSTRKFTAPAMPHPNTRGPIQLVFDSDIPGRLINSLDRFTDRLEEDQLDDDVLKKAKRELNTLTEFGSRRSVRGETSVIVAFSAIIAFPVQMLCEVLGVDADYLDGPKILNLDADWAWIIDDQPITIFAHKAPAVFDKASPQIISMARRQQTLDFTSPSTNAEGMLAKLILVSLAEGFNYCVLHCSTSFIVIYLVRNTQSGRHQARISDIIPLTSPTIPVLALMLALILHSRRDGSALEYQPLGLNVASPSDDEDKDLKSSSPGPRPYNPGDPQGDASSSNDPTETSMPVPRVLAVPEYWEPEEISEPTLAALLKTTDSISLCWEMESLSQDIYRPIRRGDSSLWGDSLPINAIPRLITRSPGQRHIAPRATSPMAPFVLALNSQIGQGAVGTVYRGYFYGSSTRIVVKILPTDHMDHELEAWRKLRHLAGICIPILFGAYAIEGQEGRTDTGALVQQYVGTTLSDFDELNHEQRRELYRVVTRIHEAHVEHGDLSPWNVALREDGRVIVLDFSHSDHHECEGEESCGELEDMRRMLKLEE